ncbi:MAG: M23 family metallopeptidase, partial [Candidatus Promineifilaceae bacterium]
AAPLPRSRGHFVDYLAGEGIAALTIGAPQARLDETLTLTQVLLDNLLREINLDTTQLWLSDTDVERWHLSAESFIHPLAIGELHGVLYFLDGGRVLAIDPNLSDSTLIPVLLPGDDVEGVRVLEPLDLTTSKDALYVLDRAGDVYRFADGVWTLDRYDRPAGERSAHYFVALGADPTDTKRRHVLEASAPLLLRYADDVKNSTIPEEFYPVDVSVINGSSYSLLHEKNAPGGIIIQHDLGARRGRVSLSSPLVQPRQIAATDQHLFVLDRDGRRLQQFERESGGLVQILRFGDNRLISAMYPSSNGLILAGQDAIYRVGSSDSPAHRFLNTDHLLQYHQPHNPDVLKILANVDIPIGIPQITQRDFQMAGAPRHYRLGVHEGFDFYWQAGSAIRAAASGTVIRADWQYKNPTYWDFEKWREQSKTLGYTTEEGSDFFRGRQVWVDHGDGVVMRYVHLSAIDPAVQGGQPVEQGQVLGYVGNSGSPASQLGPNEDAHLHFEIRYNDGYIGQYIRPIEAREWIRKILR